MSKPTKPQPSDVLAGLQPQWRGSREALLRSWDSVLNEMLTLFYPPFRADDEGEMLAMSIVGIKAYAEDLADYREDQLSKAWKQVRREHKVERWPTINAILDAIKANDNRAGSRRPGGYRQATEVELEYQRVAYHGVYMNLVQDHDVDHHRRQAEARRQGIKGGYNPFAGKRSA